MLDLLAIAIRTNARCHALYIIANTDVVEALACRFEAFDNLGVIFALSLRTFRSPDQGGTAAQQQKGMNFHDKNARITRDKKKNKSECVELTE